MDRARRDVLGALAAAGAGLLVGGGAGPARADPALDVQILQTASSLERLAVDLYASLLTPDSVAGRTLAAFAPPAAREMLVGFLSTTMKQHTDHLRSCQAQTVALGGRAQDAPNPRFQQAMAPQLAGLSDPKKLVDFATALEQVATDTYLMDLPMLQDRRSKEVLAGIMGVEAQHLATLRAVAALLASPDLLAVPFPQAGVAKLPGALSTQAFPDALHRVAGPEGVADPASGAVR